MQALDEKHGDDQVANRMKRIGNKRLASSENSPDQLNDKETGVADQINIADMLFAPLALVTNRRHLIDSLSYLFPEPEGFFHF